LNVVIERISFVYFQEESEGEDYEGAAELSGSEDDLDEEEDEDAEEEGESPARGTKRKMDD